MCRTSEEVRNNAEFQTGLLGTGSLDQSNHQAIVRFHQFSTVGSQTCTVWRNYANSPSFISNSARQDDRITREEIQGEMGANWCLSKSEKHAAVKGSWK